MEDNEEMVKRLLKVFLPLLLVVLLLGGIAIYLESCFTPGNELAPPEPDQQEVNAVPETPVSVKQPEKTPVSPVAPTDSAINPQQAAVEQALNDIDPAMMKIMEEMEDGSLNQVEGAMQLLKHLNDTKIKAVPHKELRGVLVDDIPGYTAGKIKSSGAALLGISTATAERKYTSNDTEATISVRVLDTASMKKLSGTVHQLAGATNIDNETPVSIERTVDIANLKGFARHQKDKNTTQVHVFAGERFMVEANGKDINIETLTAFVAALDLNALDELVLAAQNQVNDDG